MVSWPSIVYTSQYQYPSVTYGNNSLYCVPEGMIPTMKYS